MQPNTCPRLRGLRSIFNALASFTRKASTNMKPFPGLPGLCGKGLNTLNTPQLNFRQCLGCINSLCYSAATTFTPKSVPLSLL